MSLRIRLFLLLSALVALLVAAQAWWVRSLTRELSAEVGEVALSVGSSMATVVGGGDYVVAQRQVVKDEAGAHHLSVIRRVYLSSESETSEPQEVENEEETEFVFEDLTPNGGQEADQLTTWVTTSQQETTVVVLRQGEDDEDGSLVVQGAGLDLKIPISHRGLAQRVDHFARRLQLGSFALLGIGLLLAAAVAHRVSAPLRQLSAAARRVGEGELGVQAPEPADPEIGLAVRSFNRMSSELEQHARASESMQARRHLAELGEVGRGLAHSLRNPLNALGLTVEELAARASRAGNGGGDEPTAEDEVIALASSARRHIRRIDTSIRSFLLLAAEGVGADLMAEPVDLAQLVDDVVLEAIQDGRHKVRVVVEEVEGEPLIVNAVAAELRAVVQALIINAVEASPSGATVRIALSSAMDGASDGKVRRRMEVFDQGPGLAPQVRARLFEPHLTTKPEGSGMGLFLSHRIVTERYDGSLVLDSLGLDDGSDGGTRAVLEVADRQPPLDSPPMDDAKGGELHG